MNEDDERDSGGMGLGRTLALSDGVFAIAMTLLAFQIQAPTNLGGSSLAHALRQLDDRYLVYFVSFAVIGLLWLAHHRLFSHVARTDEPFMLLNLLFLMVVAVMPFPSAVLGQFGSQSAAVVLYASAMAFAGLLLTALSLLAQRRRLFSPGTEPATIRRGLWNSSSMATVFLLSIPVALVSPATASFIWLVFVPLRLFTGKAPKRPRAQPWSDRGGADRPESGR